MLQSYKPLREGILPTEAESVQDIHLIFWPGRIVFNPKMTIFIQTNREIKI